MGWVAVGVTVGADVNVAVATEVRVCVAVGVGVRVLVAVGVGVSVTVGVGVASIVQISSKGRRLTSAFSAEPNRNLSDEEKTPFPRSRIPRFVSGNVTQR